jgi:hypothetical protein
MSSLIVMDAYIVTGPSTDTAAAYADSTIPMMEGQITYQLFLQYQSILANSSNTLACKDSQHQLIVVFSLSLPLSHFFVLIAKFLVV